MGGVWIDERGSEVLDLGECRRLLALGAKQHRHGHIGISSAGDQPPTVMPVNYTMAGLDILVVVGEGVFEHVANRLVSFEVDGVDHHGDFTGASSEAQWSVLARGLAMADTSEPTAVLPTPEVLEPGRRVLRIRTDVLTGRKLGRVPG